MNRIVIADDDGVDLGVGLINAVGVIPEAVYKLATFVIVTEQETVESMQTSVTFCLTPYACCLVLVGRIRGTLNVTGITR